MFNREESLIESGYVYNSTDRVLEHYYEEPPDYESGTYQVKEILLEDLVDWRFSYYNGELWQNTWEEADKLPQQVRIDFKFGEDSREEQFIANIPIGP